MIFFYFKKAADIFINTTKINISKVSWLKVTPNKPGKILVKKTFNKLEQWTEINVFKKGLTIKNVSEATLPILLWKSQITENKKADLKNMIGFMLKPEDKLLYECITS